MDCSLPGSSLHGILQARILEWVAISFSRGSSWLRDRTQVSCTADRLFNLWATREALIRTDSHAFLFIAEQHSIVYMYHNFLIHSPAYGHLACFHVLAVVTSAAVNVGVHVVFICISLTKIDVEHLFMCLFSHLYVFFGESVFLEILPTFWLGCLFFLYWAAWAPCIFWKLVLCHLFHLLLFSSIPGVVFSPCL